MVRTVGRTLLWTYAVLLLVAALGYARYDLYMMDGDGTSFMDIAQYLNTHQAGLAINGYWNPGYPAVLAFAERLTHPSLWQELAVVRYTNVVLFAFAIAATLFFTTALARVRDAWARTLPHAIPAGALHLLGLAMLTFSLGRELPVAAPRSDTLLYALFMLAGGLLVRSLQTPAALWLYPALGLALGLSYLTKSFAFLPTLALIAALLVASLWRQGRERLHGMLGTALFALVFIAVAGPYILAISRQLGHFTTGESARLNYAFFIDLTGRWHEWFHHDLGHAGGAFLHPEAVLATAPPTFSYAAHPQGTLPLWFDPAWWTLGLKPHVWMHGHLLRLARNFVVLVRYLLGRPEVFVFLAVVLWSGATWLGTRAVQEETVGSRHPGRNQLWLLAPAVWGLLMFAIYLPIDLQDRYLTAPLLLILLPLFACLQVRPADPLRHQQPSFLPATATALAVLFAGIALTQAFTYLADRRRHIPLDEQEHAGYDPQVFNAAAALDHLGLRPGDKVACMGDLACYTDFYWARLAGTQIEAEVETPDGASPLQVWNAIADKRTVTAPLASQGLRYLVSLFPNSAQKPEGWVQLGGTNFFAYPLRQPLSPQQAASIAAFRAAPSTGLPLTR